MFTYYYFSLCLPQPPQFGSRTSESRPPWEPDPLEGVEKDLVDGGDLQTLNRVTSLRLQQAFEHISSIKSQLITGSDTGKVRWCFPLSFFLSFFLSVCLSVCLLVLW